MEGFFEIYGTPIKLSSIKDFRIIQQEYIYRPAYSAAERKLLNVISGKKYAFCGMQPYAAIVDEKGHKSSIAEYDAKNFKESVGKDLMEGAVSAIADKLNIKALKYKKYTCVNQAGRRFTTYLEDVPAVVMNSDGKISDVYKNDELYSILGEPIAPAINIVHALLINTKESQYIFYGNGIQLDNVGLEYERLKNAMNELHENSLKNKPQKMLNTLGQLSLPKFKKKEDKSNNLQIGKRNIEQELSELKALYLEGKMSEEEYRSEMDEIMKVL